MKDTERQREEELEREQDAGNWGLQLLESMVTGLNPITKLVSMTGSIVPLF
jgi:hypothetical protein